MAPRPDHLAHARAAVAAITPNFVRLLRESAYEGPVLGRWTLGELACHVSHVFRVDTNALAGKELPITKLSPARVAEMNEEMLAADPERDRAALADRLESQLAHFLAVSDAPVSDQVAWLEDIRLPASAVACHLLEEVLVHGYDIARATKSNWRIAPEHAALAVTGAAVPIINAAEPMAFVDPERARGLRVSIDGHLRGHGRLSLEFDNGLRVSDEPLPGADIHSSADPVAMMLLFLRRIGPARAGLTGKVVVWGKGVWKLPRLLSAITPP